MGKHSDKRYWREKNRYTLFFIDLFVLLFYFWLFIIYGISSPDKYSVDPLKALTHGVAAAVCIFTVLAIRQVYKRILRYGNIGALASFVVYYFIGAVFYFLCNLLFRYSGNPENGFSVLRVTAWLVLSLSTSVFLRVAYIYMYTQACYDEKSSDLCRRILIFLFHVDAKSKEIGGFVPFTDAFKPETQAVDSVNEIQKIVRKFDLPGSIKKVSQNTKGYINKTYYVEMEISEQKVSKYILQRINTYVFKDVDAIMSNFALTAKHFREKNFELPGKREEGCIAQVIPAKDGKNYVEMDSGVWRMTTCFEHVYSLDVVDTPKTFYYAGKSFGGFLYAMSDVPVSDIKITIPNFHNVYSRYLNLEKSISWDEFHRAEEVQNEITFIRDEQGIFKKIDDAWHSGEIPTRICHNDCNLNNILFDKKTHLPVAVVDLDTIMPGTALYDYGDSMRAGTSTARDDEKDLSKVHCNLDLYEQYARGYLEACGSILTKRELELLPYSSLCITIEDGIRFLNDHIDGDVYYNISYAGQNLDRARTQMALYHDMKKKLPEIRKILQKIYDELGLEAKVTE